MLKSIYLNNFVKFKKYHYLDFSNDSPFLFIGENGTGKSAVLEGIRRCLKPELSTNVSSTPDPKKLSYFICNFENVDGENVLSGIVAMPDKLENENTDSTGNNSTDEVDNDLCLGQRFQDSEEIEQQQPDCISGENQEGEMNEMHQNDTTGNTPSQQDTYPGGGHTNKLDYYKFVTKYSKTSKETSPFVALRCDESKMFDKWMTIQTNIEFMSGFEEKPFNCQDKDIQMYLTKICNKQNFAEATEAPSENIDGNQPKESMSDQDIAQVTEAPAENNDGKHPKESLSDHDFAKATEAPFENKDGEELRIFLSDQDIFKATEALSENNDGKQPTESLSDQDIAKVTEAPSENNDGKQHKESLSDQDIPKATVAPSENNVGKQHKESSSDQDIAKVTEAPFENNDGEQPKKFLSDQDIVKATEAPSENTDGEQPEESLSDQDIARVTEAPAENSDGKQPKESLADQIIAKITEGPFENYDGEPPKEFLSDEDIVKATKAPSENTDGKQPEESLSDQDIAKVTEAPSKNNDGKQPKESLSNQDIPKGTEAPSRKYDGKQPKESLSDQDFAKATEAPSKNNYGDVLEESWSDQDIAKVTEAPSENNVCEQPKEFLSDQDITKGTEEPSENNDGKQHKESLSDQDFAKATKAPFENNDGNELEESLPDQDIAKVTDAPSENIDGEQPKESLSDQDIANVTEAPSEKNDGKQPKESLSDQDIAKAKEAPSRKYDANQLIKCFSDQVVFTFPLHSIGPVQWSESPLFSRDKRVDNYLQAEKKCEVIRSFFLDKKGTKFDKKNEDEYFKLITQKENDYFEFDEKKEQVTTPNGIFGILKIPEGIYEAKIISILLSSRCFKTIILEEPDKGMHPQFVNRMMQVIENCKMDKRVILTTHNKALVTAWSLPKCFVFREIDVEHRIFPAREIFDKPTDISMKQLRQLTSDHVSDIFFARKILFYEGDSEFLFFTELQHQILRGEFAHSKLFGSDELKKTFSELTLVKMNGIKMENLCHTLCEKLELEHLVLVDRKKHGNNVDNGDGMNEEQNREEKLKKGTFFWKDGDIEDMVLKMSQFVANPNLLENLKEQKLDLKPAHKGKEKMFLNRKVTQDNVKSAVKIIIENCKDNDDLYQFIKELGKRPLFIK